MLFTIKLKKTFKKNDFHCCGTTQKVALNGHGHDGANLFGLDMTLFIDKKNKIQNKIEIRHLKLLHQI